MQALYWTADTPRLPGLNEAAAAHCDEALPLAEQHDTVTFVTPTRIGRLAISPGGASPASLRPLLAQYRASGDRFADVGYSILLAKAHGTQGEPEAGLAALQQGCEALATGALFLAPRLRARAALLAQAGAPPAELEATLVPAPATAQGLPLLADACAQVHGPAGCPDLQAAHALLAAG